VRRSSPILVGVDKPFTIALRGYDITQVDRLFDRAQSAVASGDRRLRASMADELRSAEFPQRLQSYDRAAVDRAVEDLPA
jgi:hypothetical protein